MQLQIKIRTANAEPHQSCAKPSLQLQMSQHGPTLDFVRPSSKPDFATIAYHSKDQRKMNATELSKAAWDCKNRGIEPLISWSIICKAAAFKSSAKRCNLCPAEKLAILQADQRTLLNKRSELISKCRHRNKFK